MPQGPGQVIRFMLMAYYVSAQAEHPQACWEWLKFLTEQPELFSPYVETAHAGLPARRSVAASPVYSERVGPVLAASYRAAAEQGERAVSLVSMNRPEITLPLQWFEQALQTIMEGADVEYELNQAQRKAEAFTGCLETTTDLKDESELIDACIAQAEAAGP
jgi:ABC-type glycerol-3-phosphate transport system substrate-binding protein